MAHSPGSSSPPFKDRKSGTTDEVKDTTPFESTSSSEDSASEEELQDLPKNPFLDPHVAAHWKQVYEDAEYECRHAFDPTLTWTEEEEKRLVRKTDWRICTWAVRVHRASIVTAALTRGRQCIMFFALQVDRGNLSQALSDNLLDDLGLNTNGALLFPTGLVLS